jgi:hypothetical protein
VPLLGKLGSPCAVVIAFIVFTEADWGSVAAEMPTLATSVARDTKISFFIVLSLSPLVVTYLCFGLFRAAAGRDASAAVGQTRVAVRSGDSLYRFHRG